MEAAVCGKSVLIRRWFYGARRSFCSPARSFSAARHCAGRFSKHSAPRPGVGEKTAERILAYRDTYGKFVTIEQLLDVEGIGEGLLEQLRPYVYVEESE